MRGRAVGVVLDGDALRPDRQLGRHAARRVLNQRAGPEQHLAQAFPAEFHRLEFQFHLFAVAPHQQLGLRQAGHGPLDFLGPRCHAAVDHQQQVAGLRMPGGGRAGHGSRHQQDLAAFGVMLFHLAPPVFRQPAAQGHRQRRALPFDFQGTPVGLPPEVIEHHLDMFDRKAGDDFVGAVS